MLEFALFELDFHGLILAELVPHLFTLGLGIAKNIESVAKQAIFKAFISLVWHIEHTRKTLLLNVDQNREQDSDLREVKYKCTAEVLSIKLVDAKCVALEEFLV